MTITGIEPYRKGKYLIYLNDEASFVLYSSELKKYGLKVNNELTDELYRLILEETVIKRAKSRTLHILDRQDKTEKQLRMKLRENLYPEEAIDAFRRELPGAGAAVCCHVSTDDMQGSISAINRDRSQDA